MSLSSFFISCAKKVMSQDSIDNIVKERQKEITALENGLAESRKGMFCRMNRGVYEMYLMDPESPEAQKDIKHTEKLISDTQESIINWQDEVTPSV